MHSFLWRAFLMGSVTLFIFLFCTVLQMLFYEDFIELFLTILTDHHLDFFLLHVINVNLGLLFLSLLFLIFFHSFNGWSEILWGSFPVLTSFGLIKTFTPGHSHFFLFVSFRLFGNLSLDKKYVTCSFPTLLASELNYFRFDMKTNLQAFACFSRAFRLNFLPHPSGQSIKSF